MAKANKPKSALPYARRLLEDEYVQEQLRSAAIGLRAAYDRARKQRADATEDKRLYRNLRQAATSIRNATIAVQRPKPEPKRRTGKLAILALAIGGTAWLAMKLQQQETTAPSSAAPVRPSDGGAAPPDPVPEAEPNSPATPPPPGP